MDLLITGVVYTLDPARPRAEAVLAHGNKIACVGTRAECEKAASPNAQETREVALGAGCITPGLVDAHAHAQLFGRSLEEVDLRELTSEAECVARVAERARELPAGSWIRGQGWDQTLWQANAFPNLDALSQAAPDHPVALSRVDHHALWLNARALALCGIDRGTADPPGGKILRRDGGAPAGCLIDDADKLVTSRIPQTPRAEMRLQVIRATRALRKLGLTGMHDACARPDLLSVFDELARSGELKLRVHAMIDGQCTDEEMDARLREWLSPSTKEERDARSAELFRAGSVKLFADGAMGSRGAALFDSYEDDSGNTGLWLLEPRELRRRLSRLSSLGVQTCTHAIGDRAVFEVLDALAESARSGGANQDGKLRPRVEHLQMLRAEDVPLLVQSGAVASMQPIHAVADAHWIAPRLGEKSERAKSAYAWRRALDAGAVLALGSDVPVEPPDPRLGLHAAIARIPRGASEPWHAGEKLSLEEALRGFTEGAAFAEHRETRRGRIQRGFDADLTLWHDDLFAIAANDANAILRARVAGTVVSGELELN